MSFRIDTCVLGALRKFAGSVWRRLSLPMLCVPLVFATVARAEDATSLEFINFTSQTDDSVEIHLSFRGEPPAPVSSTQGSPAQVTLDFPGVRNNLPWSLPLPIEKGAAETVSATEIDGNTRVIVNLKNMVRFSTRAEGASVYISLEAGAPQAEATPETAAAPAADAPVAAVEAVAQEAAPAVTAPIVPEPPAAPETQAEVVKTVEAERTPPPAPATPAPAAPAKPAAAAAVELEDITVVNLPGDRPQMTLRFSKPPVKPQAFTIDDPARIALDFPGTVSKLPWKNKNVSVGLASSISVVEGGGRTRVVLNLVKLVPYEAKVENNNVVLTVKSDLAQTARGGLAAPATAGTAAATVKNIDFRRSETGSGRVIITLSNPNVVVDTRESAGQILVEFANTALPNELHQRLDVIDFATPVHFIDTTSRDDTVSMTITPKGLYEFLAFQSENTYTVEVKPVTKEQKEAAKPTEEQFTGEKLSLNFQDIEVRAVLQLLADFTGLNIVTSDTVQGSLTLRLQNVPWDQALDLILKTKGLGMRRSGNVIMIAPSEEIATREKLELESKKQVEELAPLQSELIQVNYAKATDLVELLQTQDKATLLSERGKVSVDERTNTILILETADRLANIRKLVTRLDIPVRQVLIESRIVVANNDFARDLGVRFGVTGVRDSSDHLFFGSGNSFGTDTMLNSALENIQTNTNGSPYPIQLPELGNRLNWNLPIGGTPGSIAFAILGKNTLLDLELTALQQEGRGEVISSPRVITSNQKEATIKQGTEIPYQEAASSGATSVSFKEAVLSLKVTPHITPDDRIRMDLKVTKDSIGQVVPTANGGSNPSIDKREVETQVLVQSGETVVLGGIHEQEKRETVNKVPFLGALPFIGVLFRQNLVVDQNTELLIFVTPKVLKDSFKIN
jgi:type IV pilus assembly protein PilQ